jgi:hypothetical protein
VHRKPDRAWGRTVSDESRMVQWRPMSGAEGGTLRASIITGGEESIDMVAPACNADRGRVIHYRPQPPAPDTLMPDCCAIHAVDAVGPGIASPGKRLSAMVPHEAQRRGGLQLMVSLYLEKRWRSQAGAPLATVARRLMVEFAYGMGRCVQPTHRVKLGTQVLCGCERRTDGCPIRRKKRADSEPKAALIRIA